MNIPRFIIPSLSETSHVCLKVCLCVYCECCVYVCVQKQVCACDSHVFNGKRGGVVGQSGWERRGREKRGR